MAGKRLGYLNNTLYELLNEAPSGIVDVTVGNNSTTFRDPSGTTITVPGFDALPGYDLVTGLGTVDANLFVRALAGKAGEAGGDSANN
jgi:hypothetical protein